MAAVASMQDAPVEGKHRPSEPSIQTPPASDRSSHGRREDDDASSSDLSDLDERFEEPKAEPEPIIEPNRYENGVPIFQPTMDQFQDFQKYMTGVNPYGMQSGIVLIDPPEEWKAERKALDDMIKTIKVRNPIFQEFHHNEYGIYTQRNMEKMRSYNLPQWKSLCEQSQYQPPARRGERRAKGTQSTKVVPLKRKSEPLPMPDGVKRKAGRPRVRPLKDGGEELVAPPTPTSPETTPIKEEEVDTPKRKGRPGKPKGKPGPKPKQKTEAEKATTVAARRLHNEAEATAEDVDEEDFAGFDYRIHNHDEWTKERCEELEEKYWKSLSYTNPMYGADMPGSLFDDDTKCWNVAKLPNLLDILGSKIPGVNTAYLYLGMWRATFAWHLEDVDLYSINYIHFGAPKQWYSISQADAPKFEKAMRSIYANEAKNCDQFLRHKTFLVSPSLLKNKYGVSVNRVVHREGQFVVTFPIGYHSGYNLGYNCAESVNFALESWLPYGKVSKKCRCEDDSVFIDVDWFMRRLNGEPTPELEEWVEVTDDEDGPTDLPTPPGSDRGPTKKRKRQTKDVKKVKRIKIKISRAAACSLCPNNFECDELLPTDDGASAHRRCALYTPETYFDEADSKEVIRGLANIGKARLDLRCNECRQKRGSCFQCSSAKCTRAYHATCAAQAGVQVDIGDIAIWADGVEYRDTGLDFRCKLHRSVKAPKLSSDLSKDNSRHDKSKEFKAYLRGLKKGDIVQYQPTSSDDIEAGVLVEALDEDEGILVLDLLPSRQRRYIESNTVLFVDAATSCLVKPSANAKDFPKHLRGQAMSLDDFTRKPSRLDHFCDGPDPATPYLWEEFTSSPLSTNKSQRVDLSRNNQVWHYLGKSSTETKAQYTGNIASLIHDPSSNFLQSVEPAKRPLIQIRRQSQPVDKPVHRQPVQIQQSVPVPAPGQAEREAWLARQRMHVHPEDRPYVYKPKSTMPAPNIAIDTKAIERQREFQRQAYQRSQSFSQLSSHSPQMAYQYTHPVIPSPTDVAFPQLRRSLPPSVQPGSHHQIHGVYPNHHTFTSSHPHNTHNTQNTYQNYYQQHHMMAPPTTSNTSRKSSNQAAPILTPTHATANLIPAAALKEMAPPDPIKLSEYIYVTTEKEKREKEARERGETAGTGAATGTAAAAGTEPAVDDEWVDVAKEMTMMPQKSTMSGNDLGTYVKVRHPSFTEGTGLASSYYATLSPEDKKKVDEEAARLGMK